MPHAIPTSGSVVTVPDASPPPLVTESGTDTILAVRVTPPWSQVTSSPLSLSDFIGSFELAPRSSSCPWPRSSNA